MTKFIVALALAAITQNLYAQTTYQTVYVSPLQQQVASETCYQTVTITEPRITWKAAVEYVDREVNIPVTTMTLQPQQLSSVVTQTNPPTTYLSTLECPDGQCIQTVQSQGVPLNYVPDSDRGTNVRFEPAMVITEDGEERIIRTPIRSAIAARRLNRTSTFDKDPPGLFK